MNNAESSNQISNIEKLLEEMDQCLKNNTVFTKDAETLILANELNINNYPNIPSELFTRFLITYASVVAIRKTQISSNSVNESLQRALNYFGAINELLVKTSSDEIQKLLIQDNNLNKGNSTFDTYMVPHETFDDII